VLTEGNRIHNWAYNRLCDNAAWGPVVSIGINGCRVDGLRLGGVGCDGEEGSEGVHCCLGVDVCGSRVC
jgi:hypothetical protein